jgi:chloramphenicol-sensitive protein RarD
VSDASAPAEDAQARQTRAAVGAGVLCYLIWGMVPLIFQAIGRIGPSAWEIMAHRVIWGTIATAAFLLFARKGREFLQILKAPRTLAWLALSSVLIAANWTLFVWSVNHGRTLETSLGYYITPLLNMAAGALLFGERIGRTGKIAIALAAIGVTIQTAALGHAPYISIALALSFGGYGIVRKRVAADAAPGLMMECLMLLLPAAGYFAWLEHSGHGHFFSNPHAALWLLAAGPVTTAPLLLFAWAARRIPLSAVGFLQFIAPTMTFFIGVAEGEPFTPIRALSFAFIWVGGAVFLWGALHKVRAARLAIRNAEPA